MGLFKKKVDPISERSKVLNDQIASLQAEIDRLSSQEAESAQESHSEPALPVGVVPSPQPASGAPPPRLRSTAFPHKHQGAHPPQRNPFAEPAFEEVHQSAIQLPPQPPPPANRQELGVRKYDLFSFWQRLTNHFRGPATSNPKLVNYLAAGSIQGLRPLRYEKRVARNRFIVLVVVLIAVLWGLIAVLMKRG